jgi:hypothetical protein
MASSVAPPVGGGGIERVLLGLHRAAGAGKRPAGVALRDEPAHPHGAAGGQQMVEALRPQPIGRREVAVEVAEVQRAGQRGQLMHDHLGLRLGHHPRHVLGIEGVGRDRHRAQIAHRLLLGRVARHAGHLVALRDEPRYELPSQRPGGAGDQDLHDISSGGLHP